MWGVAEKLYIVVPCPTITDKNRFAAAAGLTVVARAATTVATLSGLAWLGAMPRPAFAVDPPAVAVPAADEVGRVYTTIDGFVDDLNVGAAFTPDRWNVPFGEPTEDAVPEADDAAAARPIEVPAGSAEPVYIPVRPAAAIGGMLLTLLAPLLRSRRFRRQLS